MVLISNYSNIFFPEIVLILARNPFFTHYTFVYITLKSILILALDLCFQKNIDRPVLLKMGCKRTRTYQKHSVLTLRAYNAYIIFYKTGLHSLYVAPFSDRSHTL